MPMKQSRVASSTRHSGSVLRLLKMIEILMEELESGLNSLPEDDARKERWRYIFGDKENVISALVKLTGILVKIIPMEHELMSIINKQDAKQMENLSEEDVEIIKRYLKKIKDIKDAEHKENDAEFVNAQRLRQV